MANNPMVPPTLQPQQPQVNAMIPPVMPPPATGTGLGFQMWAQDPMNALKVQPAMTKPDTPLQPGAQASAQPPAQPYSYAANPPKPVSYAANPPIQPDQANLQQAQAKLQQYQTEGAGLNKIQNPFLRTLAHVGDIAGTILAPGVAAAIPGTTVHNWQLQKRQQGIVGQDQATIQANQQSANNQASLAKTQLETQQMPEELKIKQQNAGLKLQTMQGALLKAGQKVVDNGDGTTTVVPDETSPAYQQQQAQQGLIQAHTEAFNAQSELRAAQTEVEKSKNNPNSPAYQLATKRLAVAQQNAAAATQRAQAYQGRYLQSAYNVGLNGQALPGAPVISDDQGNQTMVGTGNASLATKNQSNAAQFNDVHGALDNLEGSAKALIAKGGSLNSPRVAAALSQPAGTLGQWLQGAGVKAGLSPEERQYVQSVAAAHENIQALRKSAGGTATDSSVAKLDALIPGAATPDINYLLGQTNQIRQTAERLGKGATVAMGGLSVKGQKNQNKTGLTMPASGAPGKGSKADPLGIR